MPGLSDRKHHCRLFWKTAGHALGAAASSGQAWRLSAANTPACASEDLPTPELPMSTGSRSGAASALSTSTVSPARPKK